MVKDVNNKQYIHSFPLSKIDVSLLRKYNIDIDINYFRYLASNLKIPFEVVITGNRYNKNQQRHTTIYDLNKVSNFLRNSVRY